MAAKRSILCFTIDPESKKRYKSAAALSGKSLKDWALRAMEEKVQKEGQMSVAERWKKAMETAERNWPIIAAGTNGPTDAAAEIRQMREKRDRDVAGR